MTKIGVFAKGAEEIVLGGTSESSSLVMTSKTVKEGLKNKIKAVFPTQAEFKKLFDSDPCWEREIWPPEGYEAPWKKQKEAN